MNLQRWIKKVAKVEALQASPSADEISIHGELARLNAELMAIRAEIATLKSGGHPGRGVQQRRSPEPPSDRRWTTLRERSGSLFLSVAVLAASLEARKLGATRMEPS